MERARMEDGQLNRFFNWAYKTRANTVKQLAEGTMMSPEKIFLSFTSHDPVFISNGPAGLNGSVKGIGFIPRKSIWRQLWKRTSSTSRASIPKIRPTAPAVCSC